MSAFRSAEPQATSGAVTFKRPRRPGSFVLAVGFGALIAPPVRAEETTPATMPAGVTARAFDALANVPGDGVVFPNWRSRERGDLGEGPGVVESLQPLRTAGQTARSSSGGAILLVKRGSKI